MTGVQTCALPISLIARSQESDRLPVRNKTDEVWNEAEDSGEETDEEDCAESEWDELDDQDFVRDWLKWQYNGRSK